MRKRKIALLLSAALVFTGAMPATVIGLAEEAAYGDAEDEGLEASEASGESAAEADILLEEAVESEEAAAESSGDAGTGAMAESASTGDEPEIALEEIVIEGIEIAEYGADAGTESAALTNDGSSFANAAGLTTDAAAQATISTAGESYYFRFTPSTDGLYSFYSTGNYDTYAYLYEGASVTEDEADYIIDNDDGPDDGNFRISISLEQGQTYYLKTRLYSISDTGAFDVYVKKINWCLKTRHGEDIEITPGQTASLEPDILLEDNISAADLTYQWKQFDGDQDAWLDITNADSYTYTASQKGSYRCVVSDETNTEYYEVFVYIDSGLNVSYASPSDLSLPAGAVTTLEVSATTNYGTLSYEWVETYYDEDEELSSHGQISWPNSPSITVEIPAGYSSAEYLCVTSDGYNNDFKLFNVSVTDCRHSYGAYVQTTAPTVFAEGVNTRTCTICGAKDTAAIPKLTPTITVNATNLTLKVKQSTTKLTVSGLAAGDYVASWKSSNTNIVTVNSNGKVTAKNKTGKATITVTLASGLTKDIAVIVQKNAVTTTKITGLPGKVSVAKGKKYTLKPVLTPITSADKVTYSTSNKKVAAVSSKGVITAKAAGTAKITVTSGKKKATVSVTVPKTKTTAITGVKSALTLKKGKTYKLKAKLTPSNSDQGITYSTSNKKVAAVDKTGKITAKKAGKATITVKSGSVKVTCVVTVKK